MLTDIFLYGWIALCAIGSVWIIVVTYLDVDLDIFIGYIITLVVVVGGFLLLSGAVNV